MANPFIGQISMFGGNFAPMGWAFCDGQLLPISQNEALFTLIGTYFGGDGQTTFGLPDLRARVPIHQGQGPVLSNYPHGSSGGVEQVTLTSSHLPAHNHALACATGAGNVVSPSNAYLAGDPTNNSGGFNSAGGSSMNASAITSAGGGQSHENRMPVLAVSFIISLEGIYPSRP